MYQRHVLSLLVALAMYISASSADILLERRMANPSAAVSSGSISATSAAATPSASDSSDDDEFNQPVDIAIDGKIFPPAIFVDGFSMYVIV